MKKLWIAISLLVLLSLIPATVFAATPVFYCSYNAPSGGNGSYSAPWLCNDNTTYQQVVTNVCAHTNPFSILYQTVSNGYYRHTFELNSSQQCVETSNVFYPGLPPNTGVALPAPLLVGGALGLGLLLVLGGVVIYRRRTA